MRKPFAVTAMTVATALLVGACGADGDTEATDPPVSDPPPTETTRPTQTRDPYAVSTPKTTTPAETTMAEEVSGDEVARITISGLSFGATPAVSVGEEVEIVNNDDFAHTWTSEDGEFDSGSIGPSGTFRHTFEEAGAFPFFCAIHPEMRGSIRVSD